MQSLLGWEEISKGGKIDVIPSKPITQKLMTHKFEDMFDMSQQVDQYVSEINSPW